MPPYSVFLGSTLIGHSDLEMHDASMGVAIGGFRPTPEYAAVRSVCITAWVGRSQERLGLRIETSDGETIPALGGVMLLDAEGFPLSEVQVEVAGIPASFHDRVFP